MENQHMQTKIFLVGAVVGGLLGTVSALLTAPKTGERLRRDIHDVYCDLTDKTQDMSYDFSKKGKKLAKQMGSNACDWMDKAKNLVGCESKEECSESSDHAMRDLLVSGLAGGIVGAVAGLLLAPKSGNKLRKDLVETYEDMSDKTQDLAHQFSRKSKKVAKNIGSQAGDWLDFAKDIVSYLSKESEEVSESVSRKAKQTLNKGQDSMQKGKQKMNDMLDWASFGFRLWQNIKERK